MSMVLMTSGDSLRVSRVAGCLKFKVLDNQGGKFTVCCELVEEVEGNIGDCGAVTGGFADVGLEVLQFFPALSLAGEGFLLAGVEEIDAANLAEVHAHGVIK